MLDVFIALIGGIYYGGKYLYYKGAQKEYEADMRERRIARERLLHAVCNEKLQDEIRRKLFDPAYADWVKAETEDVLKMLPERNRFLPKSAIWNKEYNEKLKIILAKRGYLEWSAGGPILYCFPGDADCKRLNALAKWIVEELARHENYVVIVQVGPNEYKVRKDANGRDVRRIVLLNELIDYSEKPRW